MEPVDGCESVDGWRLSVDGSEAIGGVSTANRQPSTANRLAMLTPLPPVRSGVAHYASLVLPALAERVTVQAFSSLEGYRRLDFDEVIYQLGNNPHHEAMYAEAMREPGVIVLHDLVLHHLIVEMTLARGDVEGFVAALEANHGAAGAAWARGRAIGLHHEMANFLLPASIEVANRSRAVIVHNQYAKTRLRSFGVTTPIHLVPHPYVPETRVFDRHALRARLGFSPRDRVIGFFGFLTSAKRAEVVLEAFRVARARDSSISLLIVGEPAPNIDAAALAGEGIVMTGYVADEDFASYYAIADRLVNLRYPSAGETSGTLIRAFDAGKPVVVSDYAQFAELPGDCVVKIPLGGHEVERLVSFFTGELADPSEAQRRWLEANATVERTVNGYLAAIGSAALQTERGPERRSSLPVFPRLTLLEAVFSQEDVTIVVRNDGDSTIRTRTYGRPEYRMIAKLFDGPREVEDRWLSLPCDLHRGQSTSLRFARQGHAATTLRLHHALQDVPSIEDQPWGTADVR